ncbi:MAG: hypothetical protein PUE91_06555 [Clostridiales bacterium]|nr:hypothetical protein [Clostridiales bacterium]
MDIHQWVHIFEAAPRGSARPPERKECQKGWGKSCLCRKNPGKTLGFSVFVRSGIATREPEKGKRKFWSGGACSWRAHRKFASEEQMTANGERMGGRVQIPVRFEQGLRKYNQKCEKICLRSAKNGL